MKKFKDHSFAECPEPNKHHKAKHRLIVGKSDTYRVDFKGRKLGAIGIFEKFTHYVVATSPEDAILRLYEEYQDIQQPKIKIVKD